MNGHPSFDAWRGRAFESGTHLGTDAGPGGVVLAAPVGTQAYVDPYAAHPERRSYEWSAWLSPAVSPGRPFTRLVPSWNARTPADSWLEVEARVSADGLGWSRWFCLGRWAEEDGEIYRTSVPGQGDEHVTVSTDELVAGADDSWASYQLRVTLLRPPGSTAAPRVSLLGAVACAPRSDPEAGDAVPGEAAGPARGLVLPVPAYSQQLHRGQDPHLNHGGESWCSPTSTSMVLGTWDLRPDDDALAWVDPSYADRMVNHAAHYVFDHAYHGAGNWSFNTAYAGRYGAEAFVTRLCSLAEAELLVAAGIPLVASVSFKRDQLDGAGYDTAGHLLVVVGFDDDGNVVCHDPASHEVPDNAQVPVVYDRGQFARVWQDSSCGLVYVIHPPDVPLPAPPGPDHVHW